MRVYPNKLRRTEFPRILVTEELVTRLGLTLRRSQEDIQALSVAGKQGLFSYTLAVLYDYLDDPLYPGHRPIADVHEATQDLLDYLNLSYEAAVTGSDKALEDCIERLTVRLWLLGVDDLGPEAATLFSISTYLGLALPTKVFIARD